MMASKNTGIQQRILRRLRAGKGGHYGLRMMPMIDMMFLLLIFFVVTATFRPAENFLPFQLPAAHAQQRAFGVVEPMVIEILAGPDGCVVRLGTDDVVRIGRTDAETDLATLAEKLADIMRRQKRTADDPVEIVCGADVKLRYWTQVYNLLIGLGVKDVTIYQTQFSPKRSRINFVSIRFFLHVSTIRTVLISFSFIIR